MSTGPTGAAGIAASNGATGPTGAGAPNAGDAKTSIQALPKFLRPNFERMPPELKLLKNWVPWGAVWTGSKWTKRPIQVSGFGASTTNPKHWSSFGDVKQAYELAVERGYIELREKGKPIQKIPVGGVGFVFDGRPDKDGLVYAGVDFDSGALKGEILSFSAERVKRLGSYKEASVSGTGLHVIVKAHPLASGIAHNGIELYTSGRFFTMTGCTGADPAPIIAAPDAFAKLAEELRTQSASSRTGEGGLQPKSGEQTADAETIAWFGKLPPEKQCEVVKYAALHIAKNSKLFELTGNGGNYQEYLKLTLALARSGVAEAEDIFVEAASTAKDADTDEALRSFFKNCEDAQPGTNGISVGTLFYIAIQCGADFTPWKEIADLSDPDVALFVPGNEKKCRKLLDRVVAADPRTYTLGDPTGPLVILRVPDADTLPPETQWKGDLPGTTLATPADVMQRAERIRWMRKGKNGTYRARPSRDFISDYLTQMWGQYGARPLRSIVRVPRIDDRGEIRFDSGYDPQTGLFHDKSPTFDVLPNPSLNDARAAAEMLLHPFSKYKFDDPVAGQALLLAAIFTAIERPFLPVAPMFVIRSSMPGTGKGKIVRSLVRLAFDTEPVAITWGGNSEEFEKRLAALLLRTPGVLSIDNANGMQIKGDLLESIITEGCADIRPLGHSKIVKVRNRSLITLTGNNPLITGDMARRALPIEVLPQSPDPERDHYPFDPAEVTQRRRTDFLMAAFTAMRAFRLAGMPRQTLPAVGSFNDWSRKVRNLVYWLTGYDVSEAFHQNKAEDPRRRGDASLLAALHQHFGAKPFKAADPITVHKRVTDQRRSPLPLPDPTPTEQALHEAIEDVLGSREANAAKAFGYWARGIKGARIEGFILETHHNPATNANDITVRRTQHGQPPGSTGSTGSI
jgi:putative DNA primase/helicase